MQTLKLMKYNILLEEKGRQHDFIYRRLAHKAGTEKRPS